jgi:hypothetical protein
VFALWTNEIRPHAGECGGRALKLYDSQTMSVVTSRVGVSPTNLPARARWFPNGDVAGGKKAGKRPIAHDL